MVAVYPVRTRVESSVDVIIKCLAKGNGTLGGADCAIVPVRVVEHHAVGVEGCTVCKALEAIVGVDNEHIAARTDERGRTVVGSASLASSRLDPRGQEEDSRPCAVDTDDPTLLQAIWVGLGVRDVPVVVDDGCFGDGSRRDGSDDGAPHRDECEGVSFDGGLVRADGGRKEKEGSTRRPDSESECI